MSGSDDGSGDYHVDLDALLGEFNMWQKVLLGAVMCESESGFKSGFKVFWA